MKKILIFTSRLLIILLFSQISFGQELGNFHNVEAFFNLNSKQIDSTLTSYGYKLKSKEKSGLVIYEKTNRLGGLLLNFKYDGGNLKSLGWDDFMTRASFMIEDIGNNKNYQIVEDKSDDALGIFFLQSANLNVIIFRTRANTQKGKIAFTVQRK